MRRPSSARVNVRTWRRRRPDFEREAAALPVDREEIEAAVRELLAAVRGGWRPDPVSTSSFFAARGVDPREGLRAFADEVGSTPWGFSDLVDRIRRRGSSAFLRPQPPARIELRQLRGIVPGPPIEPLRRTLPRHLRIRREH